MRSVLKEILRGRNRTTAEWDEYLTAYDIESGLESVQNLIATSTSLMVSLAKIGPRANREIQPQCAVLINILGYLVHQLERLVTWKREACDVLAWVARNIQELHLWTSLVAKDTSNYERFLHDTEVETSELYAALGILEDSPGTSNSEFGAMAKAMRERYRKLGLPDRRVRLSKTEARLYRFASKYVHASSWLINNQLELLNNEQIRKLLHVTAQADAEITLSLILEETDRILSQVKKRLSLKQT